jgi:hypothetical protein
MEPVCRARFYQTRSLQGPPVSRQPTMAHLSKAQNEQMATALSGPCLPNKLVSEASAGPSLWKAAHFKRQEVGLFATGCLVVSHLTRPRDSAAFRRRS